MSGRWHRDCGFVGSAAIKRAVWVCWAVAVLLASSFLSAKAAEAPTSDYRLGPADTIRIHVFQNPDLTLETRLSEGGSISYPLVGNLQLGGKTVGEAEQAIAAALRDGGFVKNPQVIVVRVQSRGHQVSLLGLVGKPMQYPLDTTGVRLSQLLAVAGGIAAGGADIVIVVGLRDGKPYRREIDFPGMFLDNRLEDDIVMEGGDTVYVHRAPSFYIYGEVQRPGAHRLERRLTIQQALVTAGGPSLRGTERGLRLHRRSADGKIEVIEPKPHDPVLADDVLFVRESLF